MSTDAASAQQHLTRARQHMEHGQLQEALTALEQALKLHDPSDVIFVAQLARAFQNLRHRFENRG